jgi:hypothetical protein
MFILQGMVDNIDLLINIVKKGAAKNSNQFPHNEVKTFLDSVAGYNFIYQLLPQDHDDDERKIYQDLIASLIILEPLVKNEDGKVSFSSILKAVRYFLVKMDKLLEEKLKLEGDKINLEHQINLLTAKLDSILKKTEGSSPVNNEKGIPEIKY